MDQTRRGFLRVSGAVLTCTCVGALGARAGSGGQTACNHDAEDVPGPRKALVVYGTRAGSTLEVADFIGRTLTQSGWLVDVENAEAAGSLAGYQAAVIGSAIRRGSVLREVQEFVNARGAELRRIPVAYFVVGMGLREDTPQSRAKMDASLDPLRAQVRPVAVGSFAGKMDYSKLKRRTRLMVKARHIPEGDFRDWRAIAAWAQLLTPALEGWSVRESLHPARSERGGCTLGC